jgi:hypothetical protein
MKIRIDEQDSINNKKRIPKISSSDTGVFVKMIIHIRQMRQIKPTKT